MKSCNNHNCPEVNPQPLLNFNKDRTKNDGLQRHCVTCTRNNTKKWMKRNKERVKSYKEKWNKEFRQENLLIYRYGINKHQYNEMFEAQEGSCLICKKHQSNFKKKLHVDHCHVTGKVRGLLCFKCNSAIGYLEESLEYLKAAIDYLTPHKEVK